MKKVIEIKGMSCEHCKNRVENALNAMQGVKAKVDLRKGIATVDLVAEISDAALQGTVQEAGYEVITISEKKKLFG